MMDDGELIVMWRQAKDQREQVKILAELNGVSTAVMAEKLTALGCQLPELPAAWLRGVPPLKAKDPIFDMDRASALFAEGKSDLDVHKRRGLDYVVTEEDKELAMTLLGAFGKAIPVAEHLMDVVVGVSGSSPAYVFLFIEAMADAAVAAGMPRAMAYEFCAQAVLGSAKLLLETGKHPGELKDMVCSPGGTTIAAVQVLEEMGFRGAVMDAVEACIEKSRNL